MKKVFGFIVAILLLASCANESYEINGSVENISEGKVLLQNIENNNYHTVDSTELVDGKFTFKGNVEMSDIYFIKIDGVRFNIQLFLENSKIDIKVNPDDFAGIEVSGSATHAIYDEFLTGMNEFRAQIDAITEQYRQATTEGTISEAFQAELTEQANAVYEAQDAYLKSFTFENTTNIVGPFIASQITHLLSVEEMDKFLAEVSEDLKDVPYVITLQEKADLSRKTAIGQPMIDFTMNDTEGNPVTVSEINAKLLLIDFWAAWCVPCRKENPNVVALYKEYKSKGLEILGVSFDRTKEDWLKAIQDDGITWLQVSDLQYWQNAAGQLYGIQSIPATLLIDENGIIVAKNLRGEELKAKVAEILN